MNRLVLKVSLQSLEVGVESEIVFVLVRVGLINFWVLWAGIFSVHERLHDKRDSWNGQVADVGADVK